MSGPAQPPAAAKKHAPTLYFIAGLKIFKGLLLLALAVGIIALAGKDLQGIFDKMVRWVHLDPESGFFASINDWLTEVTPGTLRRFARLPLLYGMFLVVSGSGLALRAKWAIWLGIGESAFFIPIEIYELIRQRIPDGEPHHGVMAHPRISMAIVLALNVLIVWYLYRNRNRLFRHHRH